MTALLARIARARREGRLRSALSARADPVVRGLAYLVRDPAQGRVVLDVPELIEPDPADAVLVDRIFRSFVRMKEDERSAPAVYRPAAVWRDQLDLAYAPMARSLASNDPGPFHRFLANFGTWPHYTGVESTTALRDAVRTPLHRRAAATAMFLEPLRLWQWFHGGRVPLARLGYPRIGNQAGALIDGTFVGPGSFFSEIYGSLLAGLLADRKRPVIAELGAGYGKLAYFILRDLGSWAFVDVDLPETLCLAAYYLIKAFPGKRALLYGERDGPVDLAAWDLVFLPSFAIERLPDDSAELFMNKNSLGEMTADAARHYVAHMSRTTARWLFHLNHELLRNRYSDGTSGLLGHEYPVPADRFRLVFRYPDLGHAIRSGKLDRGMDLFVYLYERR